MKTFKRLNATKKLRNDSFDLYKATNIRRSKTYKEVAARRTFTLSMRNIIGLEYLAFCPGIPLESEFGGIMFPFLWDGTIKETDTFFKKAKKSLELYRGEKYSFRSEEHFKALGVDTLFQTLFTGTPVYIKGENHQDILIDEKSSEYWVDYSVLLNFPEVSENLETYHLPLMNVPFVVIECSKDPIIPHFAHKDGSKIATLMSISLMKLLECFHRQPISFLSGLFVQGVLMGGFDLEFLVMKPEFAVSAKDGDEEILVSFLLSSSRRNCRFSLYRNGVYEHDLRDESVYCSFREGFKYSPPESALFLETTIESGNESEFEEVEHSILSYEEEILVEDANAGKRTRLADDNLLPPSSSTLTNWDVNPSRSEIQNLVDYMLIRKDRSVDLNTLLVLTRVRDMTLKLINYLEENVPPMTTEDDDEDEEESRKFRIPPKFKKFYSDSRSRHSSYLNTHDSDQPRKCDNSTINTSPNGPGNEENCVADQQQHDGSKHLLQNHRRRSSYHLVKDKFGLWVQVAKRVSECEIEIYSNPLIRSSCFFPRLHPELAPRTKYDDGGGGVLHLTIEKIQPLSRIHGLSESFSKIRRCLQTFLSDGIEALMLLHQAGFVHSDLSPNNIGYNKRLGNWQIFDFDHSLPIESSLKCPRTAGTRHFVSPVALKTRLFRPIDDFISLVLSIKHGIPSNLDPESFFDYSRFDELMNDILSSSEVNPNWLAQSKL